MGTDPEGPRPLRDFSAIEGLLINLGVLLSLVWCTFGFTGDVDLDIKNLVYLPFGSEVGKVRDYKEFTKTYYLSGASGFCWF